jgi:hypothetical protein
MLTAKMLKMLQVKLYCHIISNKLLSNWQLGLENFSGHFVSEKPFLLFKFCLHLWDIEKTNTKWAVFVHMR